MAQRTLISESIFTGNILSHNHSFYVCPGGIWKKQIQRWSHTTEIEMCSVHWFGTVESFTKEYGQVCGTAEIYVSKAGHGTKNKEPTFQSTCPQRAAPCWVPKVSRCMTDHYWSALDLRLQEALRSHFQDSHMPDARLYSLAKLQQFSKNACNSKHFSLNRPVFVELGVTGTFPDNSTPIYSAHPRSLGGTTPLTHRYA